MSHKKKTASMKNNKKSSTFSIVCSAIGLFLLLGGLSFLLRTLWSSWWQLSIIFLIGLIIILIIAVVDFLISIGVIKRGLVYSCISSLIRIGMIILFIVRAVNEYEFEMKYGMSNFKFYLGLTVLFIIVTIPSVINTIRLFSLRKNKK